MPSRRHSSAMLSSPRKPDKTMRIFSSAENCRRVARRICFTTCSAGSFGGPDFCPSFAPSIGYDGPEILPITISRFCLIAADAGQPCLAVLQRPQRDDRRNDKAVHLDVERIERPPTKAGSHRTALLGIQFAKPANHRVSPLWFSQCLTRRWSRPRPVAGRDLSSDSGQDRQSRPVGIMYQPGIDGPNREVSHGSALYRRGTGVSPSFPGRPPPKCGVFRLQPRSALLRQTRCWSGESRANLSLPPNSLLAGKIQGILRHMASEEPGLAPKSA